MPKQYIDLPDMQAYHNGIVNFINTQVTNVVQETTSSTAPQSAATGDFWTELINENNND